MPGGRSAPSGPALAARLVVAAEDHEARADERERGGEREREEDPERHRSGGYGEDGAASPGVLHFVKHESPTAIQEFLP